MSYGDINLGVISEDKMTDIAQLQGEVDQIRGIMNQIRASDDSYTGVSNQPALPNTIDDNRSSLLSILSKVR